MKWKSNLSPFSICVTLSHLFNLSEVALHFFWIKSSHASVSVRSAFGVSRLLDTLKTLLSHNGDYAGYCQVNLWIWVMFLSWCQWRYSPAGSSSMTHFSNDQFQTLTELKVNATHFFMAVEPICKQHGGFKTLSSTKKTCVQHNALQSTFDYTFFNLCQLPDSAGTACIRICSRNRRQLNKNRTHSKWCLCVYTCLLHAHNGTTSLKMWGVVVCVCEWLSVTGGFTQPEVRTMIGWRPPTLWSITWTALTCFWGSDSGE